MDRLMYFLAGLALGHILSRQDKEKANPSAFVPMQLPMLPQMNPMMMQPPMMQQPPPMPQQAPPKPSGQRGCTFKCWLCDGTTSFHYTSQAEPAQFQVECSRCGMQNLVKIES